MMTKEFFGKKLRRCRKHKRSYIFVCPRCYDPQWDIPILLRVPVKERPFAAALPDRTLEFELKPGGR